MVYQGIILCAAFLSLCPIVKRLTPKIASIHTTAQISEENPYRWIQITDQHKKEKIWNLACNKIIEKGSSLSPDGKKLIKLTQHDQTDTVSYYHVSLRDTKSNNCLMEEEFEHDQHPILFFTPDNKTVIKLGSIMNIWDNSPKTVN